MKWLMLSMGLLLSSTAVAESFSEAFLDGTNFSASQVSQPASALKTMNPSSIFNGYTSNPSQTKYYEGGTQSSTNLSQDAATTFATDPNSQAILTSFMTRPDVKVDNNSQGMQKSKLITSDAANIVNGISDEFVDCNQTKQCTATYTNQVCNEPAHQGTQVCSQNLRVQAIPAQVVNADISVNVSAKNSSPVTLTIDLATGKVLQQSGKIASLSASGNTGSMPCEAASANITNVKSTHNASKVALSSGPSCGNHMQVTVQVSKARAYYFYNTQASFTIHVTGKVPEVVTESWEDQCGGLEQEVSVGVCSLQKDVCTMGKETRVINGVSVTRDCWQKQDSFQCGQASPSDNNCQPLRDKGCEQLNSTCKTKIGEVCVVYDQTYRCPTQTCSGGDGIICNGQTFCLQGNCTDTSRTPDQNFSKSASQLNAGADASKQYDNTIFKGHSETCGDDEAGYSNCCRDSGWGQDANLAHCSQSEKELGDHKDKGLTIYVGRYCSHKTLGVCTAHKKSYCTFQSKLAKIIEQQGRQGQLGIGFGGASDPNCQGLTPDQLSHVDFDKIDFSEYYADLYAKENVTDPSAVNQKIQDEINQMYKPS